jgi:uncharacterized repeat protein (TIGR01451 family)
VKNAGPDDATAVTVTDRLVPGLAFASAAPDLGSYVPASGSWTVGTLPVGSAATLLLRAVVVPGNAGATLADTAFAHSAATGDPSASNDAATVAVVVQSADLAVSLAADRSQANQGDLVTYTITLSNNGPDAATNIVVQDRLPVGLNYQSDAPSQGVYVRATGIWNAGDLANGAVATLTLRGVFDAGLAAVTVVNRAFVTAADQADPNVANDRDSVGVAITNADLRLAVFALPPDPDVGDTLTFRVRVDNAGPDGATGVAIGNAFPPNLTLTDVTPSRGTFVPGSGMWSVGAIAAGDSAFLDLRAAVDSSALGVTFVDSARIVGADQGDTSPLDNRAAATVRVSHADLALAVVADRARPDVGDSLTWTVTLTNLGPDVAHGIAVANRATAGLGALDVLPSDGSWDAFTATWTLDSLANGASATLRLAGVVGSASVGAVLADTATSSRRTRPTPTPRTTAPSAPPS